MQITEHFLYVALILLFWNLNGYLEEQLILQGNGAKEVVRPFRENMRTTELLVITNGSHQEGAGQALAE